MRTATHVTVGRRFMHPVTRRPALPGDYDDKPTIDWAESLSPESAARFGVKVHYSRATSAEDAPKKPPEKPTKKKGKED